MFSQLSRTFTALALALSLLGGSALAAPRAQDAQQQQPAATPSKDDKGTKKIDKKAADEQAKAAADAAKNAGKALSTDEDPALIGKRKLNGGLFAKMSRSLESEVKLGRQVSAEIDRQAKLVDDPIITEYINRVGQNVVNHSDAKIPFTIKVIDSDEVNAFALPGGFFYVNKGLILAADNEAEVAGVMAHEIAHVAARHYVETEAKGTVAQIGMIAGSIFLGGIPGMILQNAGGLGLAAGFSKFSRSAESEADKLGVQYLYAAGYDPGAMSTMFEKLASQNKKKPGFFAKTFATHPQSIDRLETSKALVARFPEHEEYILNTSEFQRVKNRLLRLSNSKASLAGDLAGESTEGGPARPTLKRRSPTPDADDSKPAEKKEAPPTLKKTTPPPPPPPSDQR
ncbi:MAG: M48 family metallopeptidase [Acidobacteria bacterium]|nr:M48 family metallopeptidase [Acidobacteriota bacterium]